MKVAFLDRDGVINEEVRYLHKPSEFKYTYRCKDALKYLRNDGFEIIIVTNQAGIAKGIFTEREYYTLTNYYSQDLFDEGIEILDIFHCPHHEFATVKKYRKKCACRKPSPGMILKAMSKYEIDIESSILVGDKITDVQAGLMAGIKNSYLVESGHNIASKYYQKFSVFKNLFELTGVFLKK